MAHDINAIRKCLKDAGLYEENMDTNVMIQYYNAIKDSETTANEEDVVRRSTTEKEVPSPVPDSKESDIVNGGLEFEESDIDEPEKPTPKPRKPKKEIMNFSEMPAATEKMLDVVYHEPKYSLAIDFNSDAYKKLSLPHRVGLLFQYHTNLSKEMNALARLSIQPTPRPMDIQTSTSFSGTLLRDLSDSYDFIEQPADTVIYTSRSGRQTKRKTYCEDFDVEEALRNKKHKNDEDDWTGKRNKITEKKSIPQTQTSETQNSISKSDSQEIQTPNVNKSILNTPSTSKCDSSTSVQRRSGLKKLSNEDIMKRSSLFTPISGKRSRADTRSRTELMFDKMKEDDKKKQMLDKEKEIFEGSLQDVELEDIPEYVELAKEVNGSPSPPKKITGRRAINARKRLTPEVNEPDSTKKCTKSTPQTSTGRSFLNNLSDGQGIDIYAIESEANGEQAISVKKIDCPLCGVGYPEEEIQEHASTCCEPIDTSQSQITLRSSVKS